EERRKIARPLHAGGRRGVRRRPRCGPDADRRARAVTWYTSGAHRSRRLRPGRTAHRHLGIATGAIAHRAARRRADCDERAAGAEGEARGEVVFNTSMTGYQEVLTDPSYAGQIVTMTCPEIGNYGVSPDDVESRAPQVAGFIVRDESPMASNWRAESTLRDYLVDHQIVAIADI